MLRKLSCKSDFSAVKQQVAGYYFVRITKITCVCLKPGPFPPRKRTFSGLVFSLSPCAFRITGDWGLSAVANDINLNPDGSRPVGDCRWAAAKPAKSRVQALLKDGRIAQLVEISSDWINTRFLFLWQLRCSPLIFYDKGICVK